MSVTAEPVVDRDGGPAWEPRGHPVRWAVGILGLIVALSLTSISFGALTPRVDLDPVAWGSESGRSDVVYAVVEVTNDALAEVRLVSAGESLPGLELTAISVGPDGDEVVAGRPAPLDSAITIGPRETVMVGLRYRVTDCALVPRDPPDIPLVLRTVVGLTRTSGFEALETDGYGAPLPWTGSLIDRLC